MEKKTQKKGGLSLETKDLKIGSNNYNEDELIFHRKNHNYTWKSSLV